jgi:uroporphyrinogen-III synthase
MANLVITRPVGQSMGLMQLLAERVPQLHLLHLPLLSIVPNENEAEGKRLSDLVESVDLAVFVSPNAIECGMRLLAKDWPIRLPLAVVGGGSVQALTHRGITAEHGYILHCPKDPKNWDSEGLWAELNQLSPSWKNKKILFIKGSGGREWLAEHFLTAGAQIYSVNTYRRIPLAKESLIWKDLRDLQAIDSACLITSSEAARYFSEFLQGVDWGVSWKNEATIICSHERILDALKEEGFKKVELCSAGDNNLALASENWFNTLNK